MRRFRRICEHTQSVVSVVRRQPLPPASPRAARRNSTNKTDGQPQPPSRSSQVSASTASPAGKNEVSDSSSCNSDVSHGIEPNKNGPSNALAVPLVPASTTVSSNAATDAKEAVSDRTHHENKASPSSIPTQKVSQTILLISNKTLNVEPTSLLSYKYICCYE